MSRGRKRWAAYFVGLTLILTPAAYCADALTPELEQPQLDQRVTVQNLRIGVDLTYASLNVGGTHFAGGGVGVNGTYGLSRRWGIGLGVRQSFTTTLAALFTAIDIDATFAFLGAMSLEKRAAVVDGRKVVSIETPNAGGLYAHLYTEEVFINTTAQIVPFPGLGLGLTFEFPSTENFNFAVGGRIDRLSNDINRIYPFQFFFRISFWM